MAVSGEKRAGLKGLFWLFYPVWSENIHVNRGPFLKVYVFTYSPCNALQKEGILERNGDPPCSFTAAFPFPQCAVNCVFNTNIASGFPEQIRRRLVVECSAKRICTQVAQ